MTGIEHGVVQGILPWAAETAPVLGTAALVAVRVLVAVGVLVVVPLGLRLIGGVPAVVVRWWPVPAAVGAASMWAPRGAPAVVAAAGYAGAAWLLVGVGVARALRWWSSGRRPGGSRSDLAVEVAVLTALAGPAVAATALVAERGGRRLFGFDLDVLTLTVPHLHYAGFVAALVAGLVAREVGGAAGRFAAWTVPIGTLVVLVGYFVDDAVELAGAIVLTAGMWTVGWLTLTRVAARAGAGGARLALGAGAVVLVATMLLALWWALGEAIGWVHPTLGWMVATHGVTNALGFAGCAVLGWRTIVKEPL